MRRVRFAPSNGRDGRSLACLAWANNCLTHRNKDSLPFRRRATVKSVTDLPIEACYRSMIQ
jgi:hypothetical protein